MKKLLGRLGLVVTLVVTGLAIGTTGAGAVNPLCNSPEYSTKDDGAKTITLRDDCTVLSTWFIPDGYTLDGAGFTVTARDGVDFPFKGAAIQNAPGATELNIKNLTITLGESSEGTCEPLLLGIFFNGVSGTITNTHILDFHQPDPLHCQKSVGIYATFAPADPETTPRKSVTISNNEITGYQKGAIVANGHIDVEISDNIIGASAKQDDLAANSIQISRGAIGEVTNNEIAGNQWTGEDDQWNATAILIFESSNVTVCGNEITGNSDAAIDISSLLSTDNVICNNTITDEGGDGPNGDVGIRDLGADNSIYGNSATGFDIPIVNAFNNLCYTLWTGALYQRDDCADWEDSFQLATYHAIGEPGSITDFDYLYDTFDICVRDNTDNGLARYDPDNDNCDSLWDWWISEDRYTYPNGNLISICVDDDSGRVRVSESCSGNEWAGQI